MGGSWSSKPATKTDKVEWPAGSQEMRRWLGPQLVKGLQGQLQPYERQAIGTARDAASQEAMVAREQLLRAMGRMPGVAGPEKFQQLRQIQDQQIRAAAIAEGQIRASSQQQALQQALAYAMQPGVVTSRYKGAVQGIGEGIGNIARQAAGAYMGGMGSPTGGTTSMPAGTSGVAGANAATSSGYSSQVNSLYGTGQYSMGGSAALSAI